MLDHVAVQAERDVACLASMLSFGVMALHVTVQVGRSSEARVACRTHKRSFVVVSRPNMFD